MTRHPLFGLLLAAAGALILTPDALFMRLSGMGAAQMLAWRGLLMGTALLLVWLLLARGDLRGDLRALFTVAGLSVIASQIVNAVLFSYGIATAPVSVVLFGVAAVPAFAAVFAWILIGEATHWSTWAAIAAVTLGIGIAVLGDGGGIAGFNAAALRGALAGLGVAATLAIIFVLIRANARLPILPAIGCGALIAGAIGFAMTGPAAVMDGAVWAIVISGALLLPVSFFALSLASRYTHASNVSLLLLLETILGPAWVWYGTSEAPTPTMVLGGGIVVISLAIYIVYTGRRQARTRRHARWDASVGQS